MMVQDLYSGLLWGEDPRKLLVGLRRRLHSFFQETHDWASITAYTSLPPNFDQQLLEASIAQANSAIDASLRNADRVLHKYLALSKRTEKLTINSFAENLNAAKQQIVEAKQRLLSLIDSNPDQEAQIQGQLASTQKREAQLRFHAIPNWQLASEENKNQVIHDLDLARSRYLKADQLDKDSVWAQVQYLSLTLLLGSVQNLTSIQSIQLVQSQDILAIWLMAEVRIKNAITTQENNNKAWSYGYLAELYLIAPLIPQLSEIRPDDNFRTMAIDAAKMVSILMGHDSIHIYSTRRQIYRYIDWLGVISNDFHQLEDTAKEIIKALPGSDKLNSFH
jgi:hypothetical protein